MASGAAASRKTKKISSESRGRRKNSNKSLKRRRVSSSSSSYYSDSEDDPRKRGCQANSRCKPDKRRGREKKRSENRKSQRFHHRGASSSWNSCSSCSTCRTRSSGSLERCRSPFRHQEFRKGKRKIKSRGRKLDRGRKMSSSCSTCSGSSSWSSSSGRLQSFREGRRREKGDLRQKEKREKGGFGLSESSLMDRSRDREGKYGNVGKENNNQVDSKNHDCSQAAKGIVAHNVERVEQDEMMDPGYYDHAAEMDRWMDEGKVEKDYYFVQSEGCAFGRQEAHSLESYQHGKSYFEGSDGCHTYEIKYNSEIGRRIKSEVVAVDKIASESDELELLLRQKALENFKKLREGQSVNNRSSGHRKNDSGGNEFSEKPCITAINNITASESYSISEREVLVGAHLHESKANHFTSLSTSLCSKQLDQAILMSQGASGEPYIGRDFPEKISPKKPENVGSQEKAFFAECGTSDKLNDGVNIHGSLENVDVEKKDHGSHEKLNESGSQFEQKTFSRMHDGEMVQVSYKVYIPKKAPVLARRKLQR